MTERPDLNESPDPEPRAADPLTAEGLLAAAAAAAAGPLSGEALSGEALDDALALALAGPFDDDERPIAASIDTALAWCDDLLGLPAWEEIGDRLTALVMSPPDGEALSARGLAAWFVIDGQSTRHLVAPWHNLVAASGARVERQIAGGGLHATLTVITEDAAAKRLESVARSGLETRWLVQHATAAHDPMRRHALMIGAARRLPDGGLERACRGQYLAATAAFRSLLTGGVTPVTLGEAAAAVARLSCIIDWGCHPPAEWLEAVARQSVLGRRLDAWFEDVPNALAGEDRAARWVVDAGSGVLREAHAALRAEYGGSDWLRDPDSFSLRGQR